MMKTVQLGHTDEQVSSMCLGAMYFGSQIDEEQSARLLNLYRASGGNFIDTANNYAFWVNGYQGGESEKLLGRWMQAQGNRHELFLATKVGFNMPPRVPISLSRQTIMDYCEQSLRNLQTDRIDLYYAHTDDRDTPLEETLEAFNDLIQSGKVRYIGCSNILAWRIQQAHSISERNDWAKYCIVQQRYSYLQPKGRVTAFGNGHVPVTQEILDYATTQQDFSIIAYSILLGGVYSRKSGDIDETYQPHLYDNVVTERKLAMVKAIAKEADATPNQVVIAWLIQHMPNMIALVSSRSLERLQENLDAAHVILTDDQIERLNAVQ